MNKRIITLFVGLALIVLLAVLNGAVFVVKEIEVRFQTPQHLEDQQELEQRIIDASGITIGKNIFTIRESTATENIRSAIADIDVLAVERYTDKVVLYVARRVPVMAIPVESAEPDTYVIVDTVMTALRTVTNATREDLAGLIVADIIPLKGGTISIGRTLTGYGDTITRFQNVVVAFQYAGLSPEGIAGFIGRVETEENRIILYTREGLEVYVDVRERGESDGAMLTSEQISERVQNFYTEWLKNPASSGQAKFDYVQGKYVFYNTDI